MFFRRSEEHQKFVAEVRLNWNSTEQSPQNQIGAPDQLHSELNLRPPDCNRTRPWSIACQVGQLRVELVKLHVNYAKREHQSQLESHPANIFPMY